MGTPTDRRMVINVILLSIAQALLLTTMVGGMAVSGLVGRALSAQPTLATLPVAALLVGPFLTSWPASMFMARYSRRAGFILGSALGGLGGALSAVAIALNDFWLFCLGHLLIGAFQGFGNYYRFAAMEVADETFRHRATSWVIAGGVIAAFAGPALAHATRTLGPVEYLATYLTMVGLGILSWAVIRQLSMTNAPAASSSADAVRPLKEIAFSYRIVAAVSTSAIGYAVMILAMTATPLAMVECGHSLADSRSVIQWHVLGMFAPSFFTGRLIQRFGAACIAMVGIAFLAGHVLIAASGVELLQFTSALLLLGIGWNFTFIGGTALLGQAHAPGERAKVQALNEFFVFGLSACASLSAGWLLVRVGWDDLNLMLLAPLAFSAIILLPSVVSFPRAVLPRVAKERR